MLNLAANAYDCNRSPRIWLVYVRQTYQFHILQEDDLRRFLNFKDGHPCKLPSKDVTVFDMASNANYESQFRDYLDIDERSRNLDRSFRNIYIIPSFPTREQHAHSVQNARSRFTKLNQSYSC